MKRIVTFLGVLLLVSTAAAALANSPSHNVLAVPRTGLVARHTTTPKPTSLPAVTAPVVPTPSSIYPKHPYVTPDPTPMPTATPVYVPVASPSPSPTVSPIPRGGCGNCGNMTPPPNTSGKGAVMCPMYCEN
jgi:hypothetical protein